MILGPTQEEVVALLAAGDLPSYRDLPVNVYQVEWKYRDEFRPRFGLLRGREFLMKDAYSIDRDEDGMRESYRIMYEAYERHLRALRVGSGDRRGRPGQIGGGVNHEFMARASVGEDLVRRMRERRLPGRHGGRPAAGAGARGRGDAPLTEVDTPNTPTIESLAALLGVEPSQTLKCVMFDVAGTSTAVLVPGDREVNVDKLGKLVFPAKVRPFEDDDFAARGFVKGYVGPQGFDESVQVFADLDGPRRERLGDGVEHRRSSRHAARTRVATSAWIAGRTSSSSARATVARSTGERCTSVGRSSSGHIYQLGTKFSDRSTRHSSTRTARRSHT